MAGKGGRLVLSHSINTPDWRWQALNPWKAIIYHLLTLNLIPVTLSWLLGVSKTLPVSILSHYVPMQFQNPSSKCLLLGWLGGGVGIGRKEEPTRSSALSPGRWEVGLWWTTAWHPRLLPFNSAQSTWSELWTLSFMLGRAQRAQNYLLSWGTTGEPQYQFNPEIYRE